MTTDIEIKDLTVEYVSGGYPLRPLDSLNLHLEDGQLAILLGPSGCGKTDFKKRILPGRSGLVPEVSVVEASATEAPVT